MTMTASQGKLALNVKQTHCNRSLVAKIPVKL
jgi:hypothetical protein